MKQTRWWKFERLPTVNMLWSVVKMKTGIVKKNQCVGKAETVFCSNQNKYKPHICVIYFVNKLV